MLTLEEEQAGAGISTAAGIPDFRSPGTGLYDNLAQYDLPYAEAIFDIDYLEDHPEAFYTLAKELYPGNFKPTTSHYFFRLLQDKGILHGLWSQNIDTLERLAGVEEERLVEAHGSFATAKCLRCGNKYDKDDIKPQIMRGEVARCQEKSCKGRRDALIKPEIVFFGKSDLCHLRFQFFGLDLTTFACSDRRRSPGQILQSDEGLFVVRLAHRRRYLVDRRPLQLAHAPSPVLLSPASYQPRISRRDRTPAQLDRVRL